MTCDHVPIERTFSVDELALVRCKCGHYWREAALRIDTREYDYWLTILDLYLPRKTT